MRWRQILIEGPDCSGKSMLVNRIKNALSWDAKSLHHIKGDQFERYMREYATQQDIVFERAHVSEAVYGALWRGGNQFTLTELNVLDAFVALRMIVILALPELSVLRARYASRKYAQKIKIAELETCARLFGEYFQKNKLKPTIMYQSKDSTELESVVEKVRALVGA